MKAAAKEKKIELLPDAWPQFERMIKAVAAAGPQHAEPKPAPRKAAKKATKRAPRRGREKG